VKTAAPHVLFVVNEAAFFESHRAVLAAALRARGARVSLLAPRDAAFSRLEASGVSCIDWNLRTRSRAPRDEARAVLDAIAKVRIARPDIVHCVTIKGMLYGGIAARAANVRSTVYAVSGLGTMFTDAREAGMRTRSMRAVLVAAYRGLMGYSRARVIVQNEEDRDTLLRWQATSPSQITLVHGSGVDLDRFAVAPWPTTSPPIVLHPARLLRNKGIEEMVEAALLLRSKGSKARIVLAGGLREDHPEGIARATVESWVASGAVEWLGEVAKSEMPAWFARASVVALASHREGLPLALIEASASGRPCVTTDVPGCRQVVVHGQTGWIVPVRSAPALAEALHEALSDTAEAARRGTAARQRAEQMYGTEQVIGAQLGVYRQLCGWPHPDAA